MRLKATVCLAFVALALAGRGAGSADVTIARRGEPADCAIVIPVKSSPTQAYAAEELRDYVERLTGVRLAIRDDAGPLPAKCVRIVSSTDKALGEDGFRLKVTDGRLVVSASPVRGALYGVYEILERFGGVRWYASWHEKVPRLDRLVIPGDLDDTQVPAFLLRRPFWYDCELRRAFAARLRTNGSSASPVAPPDAKYGPDSFRFGGGLWQAHTFGALLPVAKYGATHPEYFALRGGRRLVGSPRQTQPCLTNPDVLKIVIEGVKACIRRDPGARFYGVSQNDNWNYCQCPKCAAVDAEEGSHAGTVVRFVNAVAEAVEKEFPGVTIETLAYQFSRQPPKKTRLRHNVIPCLCSIECDFARPFTESPCPQNVRFREDIKGWTSQTDMLYIWDYTTNFRHYPHILANVYSLQDNIRFFRDNKVKCLFEQGAFQGRHADFAELKTWLLAKWMWNPELPMKPLLDDFFAGYYGKGAPFVRAYFEKAHRLQRDWSSDPRRPCSIYADVTWDVFPDDFLEEAAKLWARAIEVTKDDPATSYNVRMGAFSTDYTRLERYRLRPMPNPKIVLDPNWKGDDNRLAFCRRLAQSLLARMDEAKDIRLAEGGGLNAGRIQAWRTLAAKKPVEAPKRLPKAPRVTLEESDFAVFGPGVCAELVDDPRAGNGRAVKMLNTHFEWCVQQHLGEIAFEPGVKYVLRMRVRVEAKAGRAGNAFRAGVYDDARRGDQFRMVPKVADVKPGYQWYAFPAWVPSPTQYFWIGPGWFDKAKGETSAVEGVWIDRIEFVRQTDRSL